MVNTFLIAVICVISNAIATLAGFGVGTILTPILVWFMPVKETIFLVCIVHLFHDIWKLIFFHEQINKRLVIGIGIAGICASIVSSLLLIHWQGFDLWILLGIFLIIYALILFFNPQIHLKDNWKNIIISGLITGFVSGFFGIVGVIKSSFLLSFTKTKQAFVSTSAFISFLINSVRIITYLWGGLELSRTSLNLVPLLLITAFLGTYIGRYFVHLLPEKLFRQLVLLFIMAIALMMIVYHSLNNV